MSVFNGSGEELFDQKIRDIAQSCPKVLDAGGGHGFQKVLNPYRSLFEKGQYTSMDIDDSWDPDVVGSIHDIPFPDASFDGLICISVLEHVEDPFRAVEEIYRVLKPGGKALLYVPFIYPYHSHSAEYKDYWRFTDDSLHLMFRRFSSIELAPTRRLVETWLLLIPKIGPRLAGLGRVLDRLLKTKGRQASGFNFFVVK